MRRGVAILIVKHLVEDDGERQGDAFSDPA
jgi:hypothetical protein